MMFQKYLKLYSLIFYFSYGLKLIRIGKPSYRGYWSLKLFLSSKEIAIKLNTDFNISVRDFSATSAFTPILPFAIVHHVNVNIFVLYISIWTGKTNIVKNILASLHCIDISIITSYTLAFICRSVKNLVQ